LVRFERSCGVVIFHEGPDGEREYLLLHYPTGHWDFAKGHVEKDEEDLTTALRETREETGLVDLDVDPWFRREIAYRVRKHGEQRWKTVAYLRAGLRSGEVRLSDEHTGFAWVTLEEALGRITFDSLRNVLLAAALFGKDPALFRISPPNLEEADRHLASLPHADEKLLGHLRGGSRLARGFAEGLSAAGKKVHVAATAEGGLLHDVGRALGRHEDHQVEGVRHLHGTPLAPYAFACVSHFTKGASFEELTAAGLTREGAEALFRALDAARMTPEERCVALADACMMGTKPVAPPVRFADLRRRYGPSPLIDLQERRTDAIRRDLETSIGRDPIASAGL
jgi:bis(5'-nucleosidyl)-tetraphosphatase